MTEPTRPSKLRDDPYSRVDYRRFVAWPRRIERERAVLEFFLQALPVPAVLDLGCGTGEHTRFFAAQGYEALGIDRSPKMLEAAIEETPQERLKFVEGDICALESLAEPRFGGAISLGNTLPHITRLEALQALFRGLSKVLVPGGCFLFQILNYHRILEQNIRHLPINIQKQEDHELLFLRLLTAQPDDRILFCPSTLRFDPDRDEPLEVLRSKRVELKAWQQKHLTPVLGTFGFEIRKIWGDMEFGEFSPNNSMDLVILAQLSITDNTSSQ